MRNGLIIIEIPEYNGPGVYSLADENGKQYIGSSLNVSQRIVQHDRSLIDAKNGYIQKTLSSYKMQLAVQDGMTFKASVLWELPDGGTQYDLWDAERRFCYWLVGARKLIIQKMSQITEKMNFLVCVPGVIMPHHEDGMRR